MKNCEMNALAKERTVNFSVEEITNILDNGIEKTAFRRSIENVIFNDPHMKSKDPAKINDEDVLVEGVRRMKYFFTSLSPRMDWKWWVPSSPEMEFLGRTIGNSISLMLHTGAFTPSLISFATQQQLEKWLPLAKNLHILGAYAQTELGHGTNLQALETTATFDQSRQEFILHCPKLTSMKWWPGDLATTANHALVMAQLIIKGKSYGMHAFIVQIRDLDSHEALPGVEVGSIGKNMINLGTNNGFLLLNQVRIPRENMLAKYSRVEKDGTYTKLGNNKLMYASMVNLRVLLTRNEAVLALQKACTIGARYSCVRKQGSLTSGEEIPILDYMTQQRKIIPQIAFAYASHFALRDISEFYKIFLKNSANGDLSGLAELHALTAGIKASVSEQSVKGIEIIRRGCGGHGFSESSGLPRILLRAIPSCTYEGENTVLHLQCARYLLKCAAKVLSGQSLDRSALYLAGDEKSVENLTEQQHFLNPENLLLFFNNRTRAMLKEVATELQRQVMSGKPQMEAWNNVSIQLVQVARAHMVRYIISSFFDLIKTIQCSSIVSSIMRDLCALYALYQINNHSGEFITYGKLSIEQFRTAQKAECHLLNSLRSKAVVLVDAFEFDDRILCSCIGSYDGNVYERLYENACNLPTNKNGIDTKTYELLQPLLRAGRDILNLPKSKL